MNSRLEIEPAKCAELRVKHLEMIQGIVTRMAAQAASLKNYCLTLTTTVCGFGITLHRPSVAFLALLPIIAFACLDARFLWLERGFRAQFDKTREEPLTTLPSFELHAGNNFGSSYIETFASWSVGCFYAPLALGVVLVAEIINGTL